MHSIDEFTCLEIASIASQNEHMQVYYCITQNRTVCGERGVGEI